MSDCDAILVTLLLAHLRAKDEVTENASSMCHLSHMRHCGPSQCPIVSRHQQYDARHNLLLCNMVMRGCAACSRSGMGLPVAFTLPATRSRHGEAVLRPEGIGGDLVAR